jgi:MoxR-like ATPase
VQAALLEAMEEHQVTVAGKTHKLPDLFMVLATQNPIEQEGTYPLPEAQRDRFLIHVMVRYSSDEDEKKIIRLVRGEEQPAPSSPGSQPPAVIPQKAVFDARAEIHNIAVAEAVEKYIVAIIAATRRPESYGKDLARWISVGASPRGALALDRMSRALAWLKGRDHVLPDDVRAVVLDCLRHRVLLSYEAQADGKTSDDVLTQLVKQVAIA